MQIQAFLSSLSEHFNSVTDKTFTCHIKENAVSKLTEILYRNGLKKILLLKEIQCILDKFQVTRG